MIKNKKTTGKFMSAISVALAVIMLSITVFASGVLTDIATDDYIIEVYNGENKLSLKNEPFIYDGEYYLPLRDILNGFDINDITYDSGEITVKIPTEKAKYETGVFILKIGTASIYHGNSLSDGYAVVMRCPPVLNNNTTFVTVDYFEDLMKSADLQGFRLNVIRPTEPEFYYTKGEKVFIGTAEEQDNYTGETVKRIIVGENGETIAVIPIENQIPENVNQKYYRAEKCAICESFYQGFYNQAFGCYDFNYDSVYESNLLFIEKSGKYIAYIGIADIIKIPQNDLNKDFSMTVTNTYNNLLISSLYPIDEKTARATIPNYESKTEKCCEKTEGFFEAFEKGNIEDMKKYCTNEFANDYFHNDNFLGMTSGKLKTIYSIRAFSNGNYYVCLKMTSSDLSAGNGIYYAVFEEQRNGDFLMKEFLESYSDE